MATMKHRIIYRWVFLGQMSTEDQAAIRQAIANAKSMEEVDKLQHMLRTGNFFAKNQTTKRSK